MELENKFLNEEMQIKKLNSLKNTFEDIVYKCNNNLRDKKYHKYLDPNINLKLIEICNIDLQFINDGNIDSCTYDDLIEKIKIYRNAYKNIKENKKKEKLYLENLENLKKNINFYSSFFLDKKLYNLEDEINELKNKCEKNMKWISFIEKNNNIFSPNSKEYITKEDIIEKNKLLTEIGDDLIKRYNELNNKSDNEKKSDIDSNNEKILDNEMK